jgi:hypothetical protein
MARHRERAGRDMQAKSELQKKGKKKVVDMTGKEIHTEREGYSMYITYCSVM